MVACDAVELGNQSPRHAVALIGALFQAAPCAVQQVEQRGVTEQPEIAVRAVIEEVDELAGGGESHIGLRHRTESIVGEGVPPPAPSSRVSFLVEARVGKHDDRGRRPSLEGLLELEQRLERPVAADTVIAHLEGRQRDLELPREGVGIVETLSMNERATEHPELTVAGIFCAFGSRDAKCVGPVCRRPRVPLANVKWNLPGRCR